MSSNAKIFLSPADENIPFTSLMLAKKIIPIDEVDRERLKKIACAGQSIGSSPQIQMLLQRYLTNQRKRNTIQFLENACRVGSYLTFATFFVWPASSLTRELGYGNENYLLQHASNFYIGLAGMSMLHSCVAQMRPEMRNKLLITAFGANAALNYLEEVNVDGKPVFRTSGNHSRRETDWDDFGAGIASSLVYSATILSAEYIYRFKNDDICR